MKAMTQGQAEAAFTQAIIQMEKEYLGRGPADCRTYFVEDMILIRLKGIMTLAEQKLADTKDGRSLVKETRRQLFESSRELIEEIVRRILGCSIVSLHTDMSTRTGERVLVVVVDKNLNGLFE